MKSIHISKDVRIRCGINDYKISGSGKTPVPDFREAERLFMLLNANHGSFGEISPALIYAIALIDNVFHYLIDLYIKENGKNIFENCFDSITKKSGKSKIDNFLSGYFKIFFSGEKTEEHLREEKEIKSKWISDIRKDNFLKDLITLGIGYNNKAYNPVKELFLSKKDKHNVLMDEIFNEIELYFESLPGFGNDDPGLIKFLQTPSERSPESIPDQLKFIIENWGHLLGDLKNILLTGLDHIKEENVDRGSGKGPMLPYNFSSDFQNDSENFSSDKDWMSSLILIAKSTFVWLDQLSKSYGRSITKLDQIPDEELDILASRGFSGLWLIGIWERSEASAEIKKRCGNPDAISSAYSIHDYRISSELGGEQAFLSLKERSLKRNIRLAGDMVPNHMGIDSNWVSDNPDWFISTNTPPFSSYTFNGPDLSNDNRSGIFLEDHYYNKSDASVVFKFVDNSEGEVRYIYHGNDGTSMPWNDTAQLNYLNKEVREHLISTISEIAKKFNIIRFDAAMVLTKKHFQRLWFPEPGTGGDIPSRAGNGLTVEEFSKKFPKEFWKEVVERIELTAPDTLLLAEAFWMMEPFFVRTLGMHRVYNSAFMNFLKAEKNAEFRTSIKNTIEFNPEILKRFVNFMNNPDEDTAVNQFGKDDKYFGVCTLMATLPGLPMFGHGQIEGFKEKYGMEFKKAYMNEHCDPQLLLRHEQEIFPLLKQREMFSHPDNFRLYDFIRTDGMIDENVIAFSNSHLGKSSLIVFNNKYSHTAGRIRISTPIMAINSKGERSLSTTNISDALKLTNSPDHFTIFSDNKSSMTYIRKNSEIIENGIYFELGAFKYNVFIGFKEVPDTSDNKFLKMRNFLGGKGTPDLELLYKKEIDNPVRDILKKMFDSFRNFYLQDTDTINLKKPEEYYTVLHPIVLTELKYSINTEGDLIKFRSDLNNYKNLAEFINNSLSNDDLKDHFSIVLNNCRFHAAMIPSIILKSFCIEETPSEFNKSELFKGLYLWDILEDIFTNSGNPEISHSETVEIIKITLNYYDLFSSMAVDNPEKSKLGKFFNDPGFHSFTGLTNFNDDLRYDRDKFNLVSDYLFISSLMIYQEKKELIDQNAGDFLLKLEEIYLIFTKSNKQSELSYKKLERSIYKQLDR